MEIPHMRRALGIPVIGVLVLALAGCTVSLHDDPEPTAVVIVVTATSEATQAAAESHTLSGSLRFRGGGAFNECNEDGSDGPIQAGTQISIRDASGTMLAVSKLRSGTYVNPDDDSYSYHCLFPFTIAGLPQTSFYDIAIGSGAAVTFSYDQLVSQGWSVALSTGTSLTLSDITSQMDEIKRECAAFLRFDHCDTLYTDPSN